jgi:hypothetical protein
VATYQTTFRDALPFLKRRIARLLGTAVVMVVVGGVLGAVFGAGGPAGLTTFGLGIGVAIALISAAVHDYQRTEQLYAATSPMELTVAADQMVFTSKLSHTTVYRRPGVSVAEAHGAFLITIGKGSSPVLVPVRELAASEVEALRQWITE